MRWRVGRADTAEGGSRCERDCIASSLPANLGQAFHDAGRSLVETPSDTSSIARAGNYIGRLRLSHHATAPPGRVLGVHPRGEFRTSERPQADKYMGHVSGLPFRTRRTCLSSEGGHQGPRRRHCDAKRFATTSLSNPETLNRSLRCLHRSARGITTHPIIQLDHGVTSKGMVTGGQRRYLCWTLVGPG